MEAKRRKKDKEWVQVAHSKCHVLEMAKRKIEVPKEVPIVSENKFSVLDDDDDGGSSVTISEMDEDIQPKTPKIPPIKVLSKINNIKAFHEELTKIAKDVHFRSYANTSNIITYNKVDHEAVKKFLEEKKVEFHTFSIKTELCRKLVLKGLDRSYSAEEVMSDLKIQSKNVKQVKQMTTRDRTYNAETASGEKQPRPKIGVYMVYVSRDTILKEFTEEIRYVLRHKITWEKPSANRQIATQCTRCARWGHAGHNCGMHKRCLICSGPHTLAEHKAVQEKSQKPDAVKCPNCKGEHVGSYKKCESFQKHLTERRQRAGWQRDRELAGPTNRSRPYIDTNVYRNPDISYRNILAGRGGRPAPDIQHTPPQRTGQTPNATNFLEGEVSSLFNIPLSQLMEKVKTFLPSYKNMTDRSQKQFALLGFIFDLCQ